MVHGFDNNGTTIMLTRASFVCDAPAFALISGTKNHGAICCCRKCTVRGERAWTSAEFAQLINNPRNEFGEIVLRRKDPRGRIVYLDTEAEIRTNESFRNRFDPEFHNEDTILENVEIDMTVDFPIDAMHQLYIGVTKQWASYVTEVPEFKLKASSLELMNKYMATIGKATPREFARKTRSFEFFAKFKATEWRTFLLFTGPVIMRNRISADRYNHFLALHVASKILSSKDLCHSLNDYAKSLMKIFVKNATLIYGKAFITYNVHLPDDVKKFGPLDKFSAFPFENKLGIIKKNVEKISSPPSANC